MTSVTLILIARALHILSGVIWAGFVIVVGTVVVAARFGDRPESARRLRRLMVQQGSRLVALAAVISLASGIFLFSSLHAGDRSPAAMMLGVGALAAVLSFFVGAIGSGPPEKKLAKLDEAGTGGTPTQEMSAEIAALNRRVILSARITAGLLVLSVVAMSVARYL